MKKLGTNARLKKKLHEVLDLNVAENAAMDNANNPSASNPFATLQDIISAKKIYVEQEIISSGLSETELDINTFCSQLSTDSGGDIFILPEGEDIGQIKKLIFRTDGGISTEEGYAVVEALMGSDKGTITFDSAGQYVLLQWNGDEWIIIEYGNTADPGNDPVFSS